MYPLRMVLGNPDQFVLFSIAYFKVAAGRATDQLFLLEVFVA
jgi:hypothetical protein